MLARSALAVSTSMELNVSICASALFRCGGDSLQRRDQIAASVLTTKFAKIVYLRRSSLEGISTAPDMFPFWRARNIGLHRGCDKEIAPDRRRQECQTKVRLWASGQPELATGLGWRDPSRRRPDPGRLTPRASGTWRPPQDRFARHASPRERSARPASTALSCAGRPMAQVRRSRNHAGP